ncbi:SDR family oxidoreductase [Corynebacterium sp. P7202]|uniref:SDR family oxidoreductase n=1 Tax=Corynebacterium pygosceleis TaxID=2800406 RepID=A0A9Q4GLJ5_9CORY|nr:SDR family oxidoreductase [Corynebacterium pygosceleis]MCK7636404.1 SDR family oxidoreductase [Corynebacterium pygosceleis]MCX7469282.1 SDR family oxidoreductase [Corynebacterium pygosceleis]
MSNRPVAVITGATGGIGRAVVDSLAPDFDVLALGRDGAALAELDALDHVRALRCDLVAELLDSEPGTGLREILELPRVDVVVHAAAVGHRFSVEQATPEQWRSMLDLNVVVPAELTRRLLPALRAARGNVVFINSGAGHGAHPGTTVYTATKHALRGLADSLRKEEAGTGVRVSGVAPGPTDTPMLRGIVESAGGTYTPDHYIEPGEVAAAVRLAVTAGPTAQLTDIAVRPRIELADR